jgi:hypothetical protein
MKFISILFLGIVLLGACGKDSSIPFTIVKTTPEPLPEISAQVVRKLLVGKEIKNIPHESGNGGSLEYWIFEEAEWKEIDFVETIADGNKKNVVVQIRVGHAPGVYDSDENAQTVISGRIRLSFEYISKEWALLNVENLSVKYASFKMKSQE